MKGIVTCVVINLLILAVLPICAFLYVMYIDWVLQLF